MKKLPKIFIGSTSEKIELAKALKLQLGDRDLQAKLWSQGTTFTYNKATLDGLIDIAKDSDFACFFIDAEDIAIVRGETKNIPRDNVIFEIGLFMGELGRDRVFIIMNRNVKIDKPSDFDGLNFMKYTLANNNIRDSIDNVAIEIIDKIKQLSFLDHGRQSEPKCQVDWIIAEKKIDQDVIQEKILHQKVDQSNLFFLFLQVTDCESARLITKDLVSQEKEYFIEAIYDLLGTWDLLIKFRTDADENNFKDLIINKLIESKQMNKTSEVKFSKYCLVDVQRQASILSKLLNQIDSDTINYTLLNNTDDYDKYRACRAFLYIEAKGDYGTNSRKNFIEELQKSIEKDNKGSKIIESFCEGKREIIIETFSSCSQTAFMNHLNKSVEKVLKTFQLDKSTLTCYHYDESGLKQYHIKANEL